MLTTNKNGVQLWRTEGTEPEMNKWILIGDNGFGDKSNNWSLSMGVFKEHLFMSTDGIRFMPICLNGLGNRDNYGGRILFVSSDNKLYIGTANPYEGCEVWEGDNSLRLWKI